MRRLPGRESHERYATLYIVINIQKCIIYHSLKALSWIQATPPKANASPEYLSRRRNRYFSICLFCCRMILSTVRPNQDFMPWAVPTATGNFISHSLCQVLAHYFGLFQHEKCLFGKGMDFTRFCRHKSTSSSKLLKCQRAQLV